MSTPLQLIQYMILLQTSIQIQIQFIDLSLHLQRLAQTKMTTSTYPYKEMLNYYHKIAILGEGSFGTVYLAQQITSSPPISNENVDLSNKQSLFTHQNQPKSNHQLVYHAIKKLKKNFKKEIPIETYHEMQVLKAISHENLMGYRQIIQNSRPHHTSHYIVMDFGIELMELMRTKQILISKPCIKHIIKQIVEGLAFMHEQGYIHRDVKPSNIYIMNNAKIKLGDFSISRKFPSHTQSSMIEEKEEKPQTQPSMIQEKEENLQLTGNVTTRHYRAPEIIFGSKDYDQSIDVWGLGCTLAELILHQTLFPGQTDINQLQLIFTIVGFPSQKWHDAEKLPYYFEFEPDESKNVSLDDLLPNIDQDLLDLIKGCLILDPKRRPTMKEIKKHKYFSVEVGAEIVKQFEKIVSYLHEKKIKEVLFKHKWIDS